MEMIDSLEKKLLELNKPLPKMPKEWSKAVADFLWIAAIVGVVVGVLGILTVLGVGTASGVLLVGLGAAFAASSVWSSVFLGVIGMGIAVAINLMAISPLRKKQHKGWRLLFIAALLYFALNILQSIFSGDLGGIPGSIIEVLVGLAIVGYILAQVRDYFPKEGEKSKKESAKDDADKKDSAKKIEDSQSDEKKEL